MRAAEATIFDLRGYPRGTVWQLAASFLPDPSPAALFNRPQFTGFEPNPGVTTAFVQDAGGLDPNAEPYTKPVVVMIDENAISQSEHTALFMKQMFGNITFVGSPTAGANGDLTALVLPGSVIVGFTGQSVRYPDGRQLQRVGILPDVPMMPSVRGIREGRDEVLEVARDVALDAIDALAGPMAPEAVSANQPEGPDTD